ncbi:hypothetical protein J7T55_010622 [Diaporthe amygdali]|uniref:uncharacterized protein n=1 Tax=Phomopsis amygdali TaxID=1214568 RepID=UPI0022FDB40A|nr:uncharacterized protein J7T55_010622 [Diaporthe amygdali]KAJ0100687.1 hypothetical protein J7T55_010622 [Diaporthe amygdali]
MPLGELVNGATRNLQPASRSCLLPEVSFGKNRPNSWFACSLWRQSSQSRSSYREITTELPILPSSIDAMALVACSYSLWLTTFLDLLIGLLSGSLRSRMKAYPGIGTITIGATDTNSVTGERNLYNKYASLSCHPLRFSCYRTPAAQKSRLEFHPLVTNGRNMSVITDSEELGVIARNRGFKAAAIRLKQTASSRGAQTIPELIDYNARVNPDACFCVQAVKPVGARPRNYVIFTMRQLRYAVLWCSKELRACLTGLEITNVSAETVPGPDHTFHVRPDPVALFMDSDISLLVYLFSLLALGVPVALVSIRLNPASIQHLLTVVKAQTVITSPRLVRTVESAFDTTRTTYGLGAASVHIATDFQSPNPGPANVEPSPLDATICSPGHFVTGEDRNVVILHTSGSTGLPKPIHHSHKMLLGYASCYRRTGAEDMGGLNLSMLPLYHGFGLVVACLALGIGKPLLLPPSPEVPTASLTAALIRRYRYGRRKISYAKSEVKAKEWARLANQDSASYCNIMYTNGILSLLGHETTFCLEKWTSLL